MEENKERRKSEENDEEEEKNTTRSHYEIGFLYNSTIFQNPFDFIEEIIRAILRFFGFEEASPQRCASTPSESTTTTTGDGDGGEVEEETYPKEELPPPTLPPEHGGSSGGCDGGGGGGDLADPAIGAEPVAEPVDGSQSPAVSSETIRRRPPRPGVSSGSGPQIH
ncbi:hypothetical protein RND81_03G058600 [Saponaria officinalis]|uniref:Uncharacterized protein n=1 Tax=Saponaria officinalis TaxID=3572 RepID=A0AAW1M3T1_SAPOF